MAEHIADTSALSYLFRADALDLLRLLFGTILVPTDVEAELRVGSEQGYSLPDPLAYSWMNLRDASPPPPRLPKLGRGESAVIGLAVELSAKGTAVTVILDDKPARRAAETLGIHCIGTLSVIARAKQLGHIPAARPVIEKMINLGFRAAPDLVRHVLARVGE